MASTSGPSPETLAAFAPVTTAFQRLLGDGPGGGALVVRLRGETVVNLCTGSADRAGTRPWTPATLAISFSTTKGAASTVIHRLVERGLLGYDDPVAAHWPEFAAGGKGAITVRELLTHRAGLSSVQAIAGRAEEMLDHLAMEERLAARAVHAPTSRSAYHAITYGWLLSGLARRVTGRGMRELVAIRAGRPARHRRAEHRRARGRLGADRAAGRLGAAPDRHDRPLRLARR